MIGVRDGELVMPMEVWAERGVRRRLADAQHDFWCQVAICALLLKFDDVLSWYGGVLPYVGSGAWLDSTRDIR